MRRSLVADCRVICVRWANLVVQPNIFAKQGYDCRARHPPKGHIVNYALKIRSDRALSRSAGTSRLLLIIAAVFRGFALIARWRPLIRPTQNTQPS